MSRRARRYESGPKLNIKKVIAVLVFILVVIMFIIGIKSLLNSKNIETATGKIGTVTYYTAYDNGKWGVINSKGETVIDASYDEMIVIPDNVQDIFICTYDVNYSDGTYKTKAINSKNKETITGYDKIEALGNYDENKNLWYEKNILKVEKDGKYGLINFAGNELLSPEYDSIDTLKNLENSILIQKDGLYGLCDNEGNIVIEPKYKKIDKIEDDYKNGYIVVDENNKYGIIGFDKSVVLECKYEEIKGIYANNFYAVKQDGKYVVISSEGDVILSGDFDDIVDIKDSYLIVKKGGKTGLINISGEKQIDYKYDELIYMNSEYYIAKNNNKYGIVSLEGEEKLPIQSEDISYISAGNIIIADYIENEELISKVLDTNFEEKLSGIVSEINAEKGYIRIYTDGDYKYYNFKFEEKQASDILTGNKLFLSKQDGKYGFVDKDGNVVVDYIYDDATEQNEAGYAGIKKDGLWGSIDFNGKVVVEPEYNLDNNTKINFIGAWHLCEDQNANYYLDV